MSIPWSYRCLLALAIITLIVFLPWWLASLCVVVCVVSIRKYGEAIIFGIVADGIYAAPTFSFTRLHMFMFSAIALFFIVEYIRSRIVTVQ